MSEISHKIDKVIFADDDANIRLIVQMSLEGLTKWNVFLASSGAEALKLIEAESPDLVLLDVMMPDMDGTEVLQEIKRRYGGTIPVIFMTAKVQAQEVSRYKSLGAAGVIMKPFNPMDLPSEIDSLLGQRE